MSLLLPVMYHWSPASNRARIERRGLRPTTRTAVWFRPLRVGERVGHFTEDLEDQALLCVCVGTSPSTAWAYSGAISSKPGETWDLWEVTLHEDDEVHPRSVYGHAIDEIRIANPVPRSRVWLVGSRVRGRQRFGHA